MTKLLMGVAALAMCRGAASGRDGAGRNGDARQGRRAWCCCRNSSASCRSTRPTKGAEEAAKDLQNPTALQFLGPTPQNSVAGQIEIVTNATTQGVKAIMIRTIPAIRSCRPPRRRRPKASRSSPGNSPIPSAEGEDVFVAQVDFAEIGKVMADMTLDLQGRAAANSPSFRPHRRRQSERVDRRDEDRAERSQIRQAQAGRQVYGNDESEKSYTQAQALVDKYPNLKVIMAPTSVGIVAAAKALQDEKLCDKVKISGLGLPSEMLAYTKNGCAPEFALWSFVDLGYLTYYTSYLLATDALKAQEARS